MSGKSEKDEGKVSGKVGKVNGRSGKAIKVKNVESRENKVKHENFCHHANPAIIHSNQAESDLPKWASCAYFALPSRKAHCKHLSSPTHLYIPIASSDI